MRLYNLDLSANKALERVRDVFCFGCFTGQRFSDISKLKRDDIRDGQWYLRTAKTKDPLEIPLNAFSEAIINKYLSNDEPLPVISNQKTNEHLKNLCQIARINDKRKITKYRGAEKIEEIFFKYELISTHTARRTFVTLSLEKGMRPETVMAITGHKDYKTFDKYVKISSKVKKVEMNRTWRMEPELKLAMKA
ncbi:MAG: integrase family protein [Ignavibacteria bacterium]|nr:integrase family protein [Ignavibacteria bacterium]